MPQPSLDQKVQEEFQHPYRQLDGQQYLEIRQGEQVQEEDHPLHGA